ncbi:MAG: hypothetical protein JNJ83_07005 [Verrucomicrobiaceae bacterium]|nr:hypothetical protein [Verrucomicrobiaceae bacterium]
MLNRLRSNLCLAVCLSLFLALLTAWVVIDRPEKAEKRLSERILSGKAVPHHFYVPVYLWRGLTLNVVLAGLASVAAVFAGRKICGSEVQIPKASRLEQGAVAVCLLIAGLTSAVRLGHSTWGDEDYTVKTYINPQYELKADGRLTQRPVEWHEVLWHFKRPNNHVGYTAMARLVHEQFFERGDAPSDPIFSETLVRLPAFLFGLLSVISLVWMARVWGWGRAVPVILVFYVTHPWLVRFASDARAYSVVLAGLPALWALGKLAVDSQKWRWWLLFTLSQAFVFWCYWGVVYLLVPLHVGLVWAIFRGAHSKPDRATALSRWFISATLSAGIIVLLMAPNLPQLLDFIRTSTDKIQGGMDLAWWEDALGSLLFGTPWNAWDRNAPLCVALELMDWRNTLSAGMAAVVLGLASIKGVMNLWKSSERWILVPILGGPALFFAHMSISGIKPYHWYLTLFFPGFLVLLLAGLSPFVNALVSFLTSGGKSGLVPLRALASGFLLMAIGLAAFVARPMREILQKHPIEACRESVALTRKVTNPRHPDFNKDSITAGFTMFTEAYDPAMVRFQTLSELKALIQSAHSSGRELYVNFSSRAFCEAHYPELFTWFDDPARFQHVATLPGQFDAATREVVRAIRTVAH